jgi:hypothetical protein
LESIPHDLAPEVTVLATQSRIESLADRIERAYRRRRAPWYRGCSSSRVWTTAAALLMRLHQEDATIPLDPELFVAVQPDTAAFVDPWIELTQPPAARRYLRRVREMIRGLRSELRGEVRIAERRVGRGEALGTVLLTPNTHLSPLGCYIVALRADRHDLAGRFRDDAARQHRSCPLYRRASIDLLAPELYPVSERPTGEELVALTRHLSPQSHLN